VSGKWRKALTGWDCPTIRVEVRDRADAGGWKWSGFISIAEK
jgi:hypothetical protein